MMRNKSLECRMGAGKNQPGCVVFSNSGNCVGGGIIAEAVPSRAKAGAAGAWAYYC